MANEKYVKQIILPDGTYYVRDEDAQSKIAALQSGMVFKGTVGSGGTITWSALPAASDAKGFTYKVIEDHSTTPICKSGDLIISNGEVWVVVPSGDEPSGTVTNVGVGTGLTSSTGGPITSTGTISVDTNVIATKDYVDNKVVAVIKDWRV